MKVSLLRPKGLQIQSVDNDDGTVLPAYIRLRKIEDADTISVLGSWYVVLPVHRFPTTHHTLSRLSLFVLLAPIWSTAILPFLPSPCLPRGLLHTIHLKGSNPTKPWYGFTAKSQDQPRPDRVAGGFRKKLTTFALREDAKGSTLSRSERRAPKLGQ